MKKETLIYLLLALFLIIVIFTVVTLSSGRTTFFGRASTSGVFSSLNSYVFASPLSARSSGDKIRVTVFALNDLGRGTANKNVTVNCKDAAVCQNGQVIFTSVQGVTDNLGQAVFDVSSPVAGKYELQASVDGIVIPQTVTIVFQ